MCRRSCHAVGFAIECGALRSERAPLVHVPMSAIPPFRSCLLRVGIASRTSQPRAVRASFQYFSTLIEYFGGLK